MPLVTGPYVSRILGPHNTGIYSYTTTIVNWFVLFGSIGVATYGNREIAYTRNNKIKLSQTFWEIFIMKMVTITVALILFYLYIFTLAQYKTYQLIQSIYVIAAALDISWLFMGVEDFKKTVVRNTLIKVISLICIFLFVRNKNDLLIYVLVLAISTLVGNLTLWPFLKEQLVSVNFSELNIFKHFKGSLSLFLPLAAIQLYVGLNKILLGTFDSVTSSGFYDKSDAIVRMVLTITTSLGTVMMPHVSRAFANGDVGKVKNLLYKSFEYITAIAVPLSFGLAAISLKFGRFFYGDGYEQVGSAMFVESIVIIVIAWAGVTGNQFLVPTNQILFYTRSIFVGATINIVCSIPLIKIFGLLGGVASMVLAETSVTIYQLFSIRKQVELKILFSDFWKYLMSGLVMFSVVVYINQKLELTFVTLFMEIVVGVFIYSIMIIIVKPRIFDDLTRLINRRQMKKR